MKSIDNYIKSLLEYNPAYAKHQDWMRRKKELQQKKQQGDSGFDPEKSKLFHQAVDYLGQQMNLDHDRKQLMWNNISRLDSNGEYTLRSYMKQGNDSRYWTYVRDMLLSYR